MINKGLGLNEDGTENMQGPIVTKKSSLFGDLFGSFNKQTINTRKDSFDETKIDEEEDQDSDNDSDWGLEEPS
jgi:hypothetical protein